MADENLKDFAVNWTIFGLLLFSLLSFTFIFMQNNNPIALNDGANEVLLQTQSNVSSNLYEIEGDTDDLLNVTANTNPEVSFLGSRDSVATAYNTAGTGQSMWTSTKVLIGWVFTGDAGKILLSVFAGLMGFLMIYFITKWIRIGA